MNTSNIIVREIDHSEVIFPRTETTSMVVCAKGPTKRKPVIVKIKNRKWYTKQDIATQSDFHAIPRKFRFKSKRQAKVFFSRGLITIGSVKQMVAVFGKPSQSVNDHSEPRKYLDVVREENHG